MMRREIYRVIFPDVIRQNKTGAAFRAAPVEFAVA
jgi:hypothetical protein